MNIHLRFELDYQLKFLYYFLSYSLQVIKNSLGLLQAKTRQRCYRQHDIFFADGVREDDGVDGPAAAVGAPHEGRVLPTLRVPKRLPLWDRCTRLDHPVRAVVDPVRSNQERERVSFAEGAAVPAVVACATAMHRCADGRVPNGIKTVRTTINIQPP